MPRTKVTITDDDRRWNKLKSDLFLKLNQNPGVFVGILEEDGIQSKLQSDDSSSETNLATVAYYNEVGTSQIPARSFIRAPFDESQGYEKLRNSLMKRVVDGKITMQSALNILGSSIAKSFRKRISDGNFTPNAESTVNNKLSDSPLIDTGQLLESIAYKLTRNGK